MLITVIRKDKVKKKMISTRNCQSENYSLKGEGETTLHILSPCFFSMPPENISKPTVF